MIQLTSSMRILSAVNTVDFRKGIDGLVGVCRNILKMTLFPVMFLHSAIVLESRLRYWRTKVRDFGYVKNDFQPIV